MAGTIDELLEVLYTEIEEAKNATFSSDKCVIDRDKVLDMIDDVKAEIPVEIKQARELMTNRNDFIASAKREAELVKKQAEDYARYAVNEDTIKLNAEAQAESIVGDAEKQAALIRKMVNEYCEGTLNKVVEEVAGALKDIEEKRTSFLKAIEQLQGSERTGAGQRRAAYDAEKDLAEDVEDFDDEDEDE